MHKEHPMPNTLATKVLKVDGPKHDNGELMKVQSALLKVCRGPMACLWAELIESNLLSNADTSVNVHHMFSVLSSVP